MREAQNGLDVLRRNPLFQDLHDEDLRAIASIVRERHYRRQMLVFLEGEPLDAIYFIRKGSVKVYTTGSDGREQILNILGARDFFPHVGLLEGGVYPATAETLEDIDLGLLRREEFRQLLREHPDIAIRLLEAMGEKLRGLQNQVKDMGLRNVPGRLASLLLRLAERHGEPAPDGVRIPLELTHQEFANLAGTSRESVSRALTSFRKEGCIRMDDAHIVIVDSEKLRSWM